MRKLDVDVVTREEGGVMITEARTKPLIGMRLVLIEIEPKREVGRSDSCL